MSYVMMRWDPKSPKQLIEYVLKILTDILIFGIWNKLVTGL